MNDIVKCFRVATCFNYSVWIGVLFDQAMAYKVFKLIVLTWQSFDFVTNNHDPFDYFNVGLIYILLIQGKIMVDLEEGDRVSVYLIKEQLVVNTVMPIVQEVVVLDKEDIMVDIL